MIKLSSAIKFRGFLTFFNAVFFALLFGLLDYVFDGMGAELHKH